VLYHQGLFYRSEGFPVEVCDTIGSGDSFWRVFYLVLQNDHYEYALQKACAVGALVATHQVLRHLFLKRVLKNI
jgi:fructokinase